jgi:predicted dehydrogenase
MESCNAYRVKILGAGSIGNHLAHASRSMGWSVDICDIDPSALDRTKTEIYPSRYGKWDAEIGLYASKDAPKGGYDFIFVGTPPDVHMTLALAAVDEEPKAILIEKPVCTPDLSNAKALMDKATSANIACFVGYDHAVGLASSRMSEMLRSGAVGTIEALDVEIREHWGGIFRAHPWLRGPQDTYLGAWKRGGGSCGEHSHGLNLWQHFSHEIGAGRITEVSASADYVSEGAVDYDKLCQVNLRTENGLLGRVVQDVVTRPPRKWARAQGQIGYVEWYCGYKRGADAVVSMLSNSNDEAKEEVFIKTRPDDFIQELRHLQAVVKSGDASASPISLSRGMDTMLVIAAVHRSAQTGKTVYIDYAKGYTPAAIGA